MSTFLSPPVDPPRIEDDGGGGGNDCWGGRHLPCIVSQRAWRWRRFLKPEFILRCWACDLNLGPFETWAMANLERQHIEET